MENQFDNIPNIPNEEIGNVPPIQVQNESFEDKEGESMWIDFQSGDDAEGIKSAGMETYVISPVTEKNLSLNGKNYLTSISPAFFNAYKPHCPRCDRKKAAQLLTLPRSRGNKAFRIGQPIAPVNVPF